MGAAGLSPRGLNELGRRELTRSGQHVPGIIAEMRACYGDQVHIIVAKQAAEFRRSGDDDQADVWVEADRLISWQESRISHPAEFGYVPDEAVPPRAVQVARI